MVIIIGHCNCILLLIVWIIIKLFSSFMYMKHLVSATDRRQYSSFFQDVYYARLCGIVCGYISFDSQKMRGFCFCKHAKRNIHMYIVFHLLPHLLYCINYTAIIAKSGTLFLSRCENF